MATITKRYNRSGQLIGWQAKIRRNGYPPQSKTCSSEKEAKEWATVTEAEMVKRTFVDRTPSDKMTFGQAIDIFIKDVTPTHKGGDIEKVRLDRFKREEDSLCRYALSNLRTEHFEDYRDQRLDEVGPGSVCRELNLLHAVLENVRRRTGLVENAVSHCKRPRVADERDVRLSPDHEKALLDALDKTRNQWIKPFVVVALETAMRRSEILSLEWRNVDLVAKTAYLPNTKMDGRSNSRSKGRTVPLSPRAITELSKLPQSISGLVFPISLDSLKHAWTRARDRAGLHYFHLHDLRHEATSRLAEKGWSILELAAVTGHSDLQMLKRYTNLRAEDLAKKLG